MASLSAYFSYDANTIDRGIPYAQFTAFQYNTGGNAWYNPTVRTSNAIFGTGQNTYGQLGLGTFGTNRNTFTQLTGNWSQIICGGYHTLALSAGTSNKWFGTGDNSFGQMALGFSGIFTPLNRNTFTALTGNWSQFACGSYHTMALSAGTTKLFGAGWNSLGQLGLNFTNQEQKSFTLVAGDWAQAACGSGHTFAMSANTNKWSGTGYNTSGQLGLGYTTPHPPDISTFTALTGNWSQVVCGSEYSMALSAGTTKWFATGQNFYGQLGLGNNGAGTDRNTFTALTGNWGQFACGGGHTMALSAGTNALFGTGYNENGQLGLGNSGAGTDRNTFTQLTGNWSQVICQGNFSMALSAGTTKWFGTGSNADGQLGLGNTVQRTTFTQLTGNWSQMACGFNHTMALPTSPLNSPLVVDNFENQPITFKMRPITNSGVTGSEASFSYAPPPVLYGAGKNDLGQLGLGNTTNRNTFTALSGNWRQISYGNGHTMALSAGTNALFATGYNFYGQLGLGNSGAGTERNTFTQLTGNWSQVACCDNGTMALSAGTTTWFGTGENFYGELGLGNTVQRTTFTQLTGNWSQVICGGVFTMALSAGTTTWFGTGLNLYGQLGLGNSTYNTFTALIGNWSQVVCGQNYTMALSAGTTKWFGTGYNGVGQCGLGNFNNASTFTQLTGNWGQIVCGYNHTMALSAGTTKLFGTGWNLFGELGLGDTGTSTKRNTFTALTGNWSQVACGASYTMAKSADTNAWFGTGYNAFGQLALGDETNRTTLTPLTGNLNMVNGRSSLCIMAIGY